MQILLFQTKLVDATVDFKKLCIPIYVQLYYVLLGYLYELPDNHILNIEIFGPCEQIYDEFLSYLSEVPDIHTQDIGTFGMYGLLMSNKVTFLSCLISTLCTMEFLANMYRFMMGV